MLTRLKRFLKRPALRLHLRLHKALHLVLGVMLLFSMSAITVWAGGQQEEVLAEGFRLVLHNALYETTPPDLNGFEDLHLKKVYASWIAVYNPAFERYLQARQPHLRFAELSTPHLREVFLSTLWYEASRAKLDPSLVLGLIEVESGFNKFAISPAGALGYMQVMPFWIGLATQNGPQLSREQPETVQSVKLLRLQINLRFGCLILRHYLDQESGNLERALGRYNGDVVNSAYRVAVLNAQKRWSSLLP